MIAFRDETKTFGWFREAGNSYDVALSSRIRVSRNLSGFKFAHLLGSDEENETQSRILSAFSSMNGGNTWLCNLLGELTPIERKMLLERNYISQQFSVQNHKAFVLRDDHRVSAMVNEIDHLRITSIRGGLCLDECWKELDAVDTRLEGSLDYAVSFEWGYLNAEVTNTGTGLRASVMMHLPALVTTGLIERVMKSIVQMGMTVKGFLGDDEDSLGDMYQISNQFALGFSEKDLLDKLDAVATQLVHYERKARNELMAKQRLETEDRIMRALGVLKYCRTITVQEAVAHLSSLRMGASLGLVDVPLEELTALFFLTQKAHIQQVIQGEADNADTLMVDSTRADVIRRALA